MHRRAKDRAVNERHAFCTLTELALFFKSLPKAFSPDSEALDPSGQTLKFIFILPFTPLFWHLYVNFMTILYESRCNRLSTWVL